MSRPELEVDVGLLEGYTTLIEIIFLKSDSHSSRCADCALMKKKIVFILCVTAWYWQANNTKTLGHIFLKTKDLENRRVICLISLVSNKRLGTVP